MSDSTDDGYEQKSQRMIELLGPEYEMSMHAVIPFHLGGTLDFYYYPKSPHGTAIATKEICDWGNPSPLNSAMRSYELVMFTRKAVNLDEVGGERESGPFGTVHRSISAVLNCIARYCPEATIEAGHTLEFPNELKGVGGKSLVFSTLPVQTEPVQIDFGLLVIIEIFRDEMELAMKRGSGELLDRLHAAGHFPYSDLDRTSVAPRRRRWKFW